MVRPWNGNASSAGSRTCTRTPRTPRSAALVSAASTGSRSPRKSERKIARAWGSMRRASGVPKSAGPGFRKASASRMICASPRRGGNRPPVRPTRSPARIIRIAAAKAMTRARSAFSGTASELAKRIEAASSTQSITLCAICHSRSRTNCASLRPDRRQSIMRSVSPGCTGRYCQKSSPMPARRRPCSPSSTVPARCSASTNSGSSAAAAPSACARRWAVWLTPPPRPG